MPLQNRVTPSGKIVADPAHGLMMGNRGGRMHHPHTKMLHPTKRWVNQQWICCQTDFNDRHREVMGPGYTELFFLDEVTALAAGHRPCFECRRAEALDFAERWRKVKRRKKRPTAKQMDEVLHEQRLFEKQKRVHRVFWEDLPDGAMIADRGGAVAKKDRWALRWSQTGYQAISDNEEQFDGKLVTCLTPPILLSILQHGFKPRWHPSALEG